MLKSLYLTFTIDAASHAPVHGSLLQSLGHTSRLYLEGITFVSITLLLISQYGGLAFSMSVTSSIDTKPQGLSAFIYWSLLAEFDICILVLDPAASFDDPLEAPLQNQSLSRTYEEMLSLDGSPVKCELAQQIGETTISDAVLQLQLQPIAIL
jgi:hypothetical protein